MKRILLCTMILLLMSSSYAQEIDPGSIYEFAKDYDAKELVQLSYESILEGKCSTWAAVREWMITGVMQPITRAMDASVGLVGPILLLAIISACMPDASGGCEGARFLLRMLLMLAYSDIAMLCFAESEDCIRSVQRFTDAAAPGIAALLASMGMNGTSALASPAAALAGGIAEDVFLKYGMLLCRIALCTSIAGNLSSVIDLNRFTGILKKTATWGTGLATMLFSAVVALQGNITEAADCMSVRAAKFAADSAAPVIGTGITEAWDGFVSGMMITKNALGFSGIIALLAAGFQPLICCICLMFILNLTSALLELFGERETATAAAQASGICQMALSFAIGALVIAIVLLGITMSVGRYFFS